MAVAPIVALCSFRGTVTYSQFFFAYLDIVDGEPLPARVSLTNARFLISPGTSRGGIATLSQTGPAPDSTVSDTIPTLQMASDGVNMFSLCAPQAEAAWLAKNNTF